MNQTHRTSGFENEFFSGGKWFSVVFQECDTFSHSRSRMDARLRERFGIGNQWWLAGRTFVALVKPPGGPLSTKVANRVSFGSKFWKKFAFAQPPGGPFSTKIENRVSFGSNFWKNSSFWKQRVLFYSDGNFFRKSRFTINPKIQIVRVF